MNSTTYGASGGGTLPRPKGMVKPRPVAKIVANARDPLSQSSTSLNDDDLKHMKNVSSFSPIKKPPLLKTSSTELQVYFKQPFPQIGKMSLSQKIGKSSPYRK